MSINDKIKAKLGHKIYIIPNPTELNYGYDPELGKYLESSNPELKDSKGGYYGAAFQIGNNIAIVSRGTNEPFGNDLKDNYKIIQQDLMPQYYENLEFANKITSKYGSGYNYIIVGHSLSAATGQLVSMTTGIPVFALDTPGIREIAINKFGAEKVESSKYLITSYVMHPNAINTYGEHIVNPIMLGTNEPKYGSSDLDTYARKHTFDYAHKVANFAPYFDSKTGKPIATVNYGVKWYNWGEGYKHFQTNYVANKFIVTGNNREAVAKDYGIPIDRVVANDASIQTIGDFPQTFTILPKFSSNKDEDKSDSSKQDKSQTKSSYSNLEFANLLNTIYMQEEQQRLYQQYINNPGKLPLNEGPGPRRTDDKKGPTTTPSKPPTDNPTMPPTNKPTNGNGPIGPNPDPSSNREGPKNPGGPKKPSGEGFFSDIFGNLFGKTNPSVDPAFDNYKPSYLNQPLYSPPVFNNNNNNFNKYIYEPSWLYTGSNFGTKNDINDFVKYQQAKSEFRSSVSSCLSSNYCRDTVSSLIEKSINYAYGSSMFAPFGLEFELRGDAPRSYTISNSAYSLMSGIRSGYSVGPWIHPLRSELGYAASHVSPLVLDLNGDGIKLIPYTRGVYFDIDNDGFMEKVGWVSPEDGQLARDVNGNGKIDNITELFGDDLISAYFKLSLLDTNHDKVIDDKDENFDELLIWQDKNSNGFSEEGELKTLKEAGIKSISLETTKDNRVIEGNLITETSRFTFTDGRTGEMADVHYHNDDMDSWYQGNQRKETNHNENSKTNGSKFKKEISEFKKNLLKALNQKALNPKSINNKDSDWVATLIKSKTTEFIDNYKVNREKELAALLDKTNEKLQYKNREHATNCAINQVESAKEANDNYKNKISKERDKLLAELQINLDSEKKDITSRYIQAYSQERESILASVNALLKARNEASLQEARVGGWSQEQFDQATEVNKAAIEEEYKNKITEFQAQNILAMQREQAEAATKYIDLFKEQEAKIDQKLQEEETNNLNEKAHVKQHHCIEEKKGLKKIFSNEYILKQKQTNIDVKELEQLLKLEADHIYKFYVNDVLLAYQNDKTQLPYFQDLSELNYIYNESKNHKQNNTQYAQEELPQISTTGIKIDPETLFLPLMRGYGKLPALHIAMSENLSLKSLVTAFVGLKLTTDFSKLQSKVMEILYEWAEVSSVKEDSRSTAGGVNIEARKVAFVEKITGQEFRQLGAARFVGQHASTAVQKAWDISLVRATKNLVIQGPLLSIFPQAEYSFENDHIKLNSTFSEIISAAKGLAHQYNLGYDFWVQLGYILALSILELEVSIYEIRSTLSELAGEPVMIDVGTFGLIGDNKDNIIKGTSGSDYIKGLGGNDKLYGGDGSDYISGDDGDDEIYGEDGIDRIYGGAGNDLMFGGRDRDFMYGGAGDDRIFGEEGDDHIEGGEGADYMDGGEGKNTLSYGDSKIGVRINLATGDASGGDADGDQFKNFQNLGGSEFNDILIGDDKDNYINGEGGDDEIHGGAGNDKLFGATGTDRLYGEEGDDILTGFEGPDHMDGGAGTDTADYSHPYATVGVNVDLAKGVGVGDYAHGDTYVNIENVRGSKFDDIITGDDQNNKLEGEAGDDVIHGGGGNDIIVDQQGRNMLYGDEGDDLILSVIGNFCFGGEGKDTISYQGLIKGVKIDMKSGSTTLKDDDSGKDTFTEFENAIGTNSGDEIIGDDNDNKLVGLGGDDIIHAGAGNDEIHPGDGDDIVYGEAGDDYMMGSAGKDLYDGGEGFDTVDYSQEPDRALYLNLKLKKNTGATFAEGDVLKNIERIIGTKFDDVMIGDDEDNQLYGGAGDDKIYGGALPHLKI
jgi:Ca2+-binding RTX toxin-like protein